MIVVAGLDGIPDPVMICPVSFVVPPPVIPVTVGLPLVRVPLNVC